MDNNSHETISILQLSILVYVFITGSAVVIGIGGEAKQNAWIAIGIATIFGMLLFRFYLWLLESFNQKNLFLLIETCFGKWVGRTIILIYIIYFFYIAARVLRDFGELMVTTIYRTTPIEVVDILLMIAVAYILKKGVEILARTSEVFIPYIILFMIFIGLGVVITGELHIKNLEPILGDGVRPILKAVFPTLITFPFGELIVFTLLLTNNSFKKKLNKVTILAIAASGLTLIYASIIQIGVLGVYIKERASFPLLSAVREISLLNFIERVDLIIVFTVMFGIIVKVSIFFYGGLRGLEHLFKIPYKKLVWPFSMQLPFFSILISPNVVEHIKEGLAFVPKYLHLPLQFGIPVLMAAILLTKKKLQK